MASDTPKISVIVPVYNVENYVARCLDSIINQDMTDIEIIVVNDGSTDESGKICEQYAKLDHRISLINQANQGLSMARNNGIAIARGDYIGFVDSDDWTKPDMYSTLYNNAVKNNADMSMVNFYSVWESDYYPFSRESSVISVFDGVYKIAHNIRTANNFAWNKLYSRRLFTEILFPKGKKYEDIFTIYKLVDLANKIVISSECKYYYCRRGDSITLSQFAMSDLDNTKAYIERYKYISGKYPHLETACRKQIFTSILWVMSKVNKINDVNLNAIVTGKIKTMISRYDYLSCGLSSDDQQVISQILC